METGRPPAARRGSLDAAGAEPAPLGHPLPSHVEALRRLAGGLAHDLNTILTVIVASAELAERELQAGASPLARLAQIRAATEQAAALTRQLLAYGRRQILRPEPLDLRELVREAAPRLRGLLGDDIALVLDAEGEPVPALADRAQLEQVLHGLAANARDALSAGGRVELSVGDVELAPDAPALRGLMPAGRYALLRLADDGIGMTADHVARVFEPFFTTKAAGLGRGLGLSTIYGIVKQSGGFIFVESEPALGTAVEVYLPRIAQLPRPAPDPAAAASAGRTILLVEDCAELRELAAESLEGFGFKVLTAPDGAAAVAFVESYGGPIDLLVSDVVMPHMGGRDLARRLQQRLPQMKVLFVSGFAAETLGERGHLERGLAFLPKPFTVEALARRVRELLEAG